MKITLKGDIKSPEKADNIITFPGGSISTGRTTNNEYWVHIELNKVLIKDAEKKSSLISEIIDSRVDYENGSVSLNDIEGINHIALRVKTRSDK